MAKQPTTSVEAYLSISTQTIPPSSGSMPPPFFVDVGGVARAKQHFNNWITCIINFARAGRISLALIWLRTLRDLEASFSPSRERSSDMQRLKNIIQDQVDSICMVVASSLGCQIDDPFSFTGKNGS
jgi:hypothetical protein